MAGPIKDGQVRLTNRHWLISEDTLRKFGCRSALLINDFIALVIPELQRRGLFRTEYEGKTLRDNLGLRTPVSRYAAA